MKLILKRKIHGIYLKTLRVEMMTSLGLQTELLVLVPPTLEVYLIAIKF